MAVIPATEPEKLKKTSARRISELMKSLQSLPPALATEEEYQTVCVQVLGIPMKDRPASLLSAIAAAFDKPVTEVSGFLKSTVRKKDFEEFVPVSGWIRDYIEWTRKTEPPTVFHFFVAAATIGATLGRRVSFDKGAYQVFPNLCVMLLAPSGRCRKTSCANLGTGLYLKSGGNLLADKLTPEYLISSLEKTPQAFIYAPELAVFLGKQKYMEGIVPLLTALLDSPAEWRGGTESKGERILTNVALSAVMCSTVDWLQSAVPPDVFGGGFMSRFLFIVQESTSRCFPLPPPLSAEVKKDLVKRLVKLRTLKAPVTFDAKADRWYDRWYRQRGGTHGSDKQFSGYYERKPDHLIRIATIMTVSQQEVLGPVSLTVEELIRAEQILLWLEEWLPGAFDQLSSSSVGEDQARIIRQLRHAGGAVEHSVLLRKNSSRVNAEQFKRAIATLREAKQVEYDATTRTYLLTPEGWG